MLSFINTIFPETLCIISILIPNFEMKMKLLSVKFVDLYERERERAVYGKHFKTSEEAAGDPVVLHDSLLFSFIRCIRKCQTG